MPATLGRSTTWAHMYLDGRGVARDWCLAYLYYLKAAEQQHERAMNLVGRCCEEGWGTARDSHAAADWYRRSAEGGYFRGQYNWASMLLKAGRFDEAAAWFERAARAARRRCAGPCCARSRAPVRRGALQRSRRTPQGARCFRDGRAPCCCALQMY